MPPGKNTRQSAKRLADQIDQAPVIVLLCATAKGTGPAASVIPSAQNLLLAARALGVGGTITTLHAQVDERVHAQVDERVHQLLGIPDTAQVVYCLPLGYPRGAFGSVQRKSLSEVCSYDRWSSN